MRCYTSLRKEGDMPKRRSRALHALMFAVLFSGRVSATSPQAVLDSYCIRCHNQKLHTAGLALDSLDAGNPGEHPEAWERVIARLRAGSMPPPGLPRPASAAYHDVASTL